jgi:hypothetical protein
MKTPAQHTRWLQVIPLAALAALAISLWRPAAETMPTGEQEWKIGELAALLASRSPSAQAIEERLRSFGPFPPDPKASRALAEAIVTCGTASLEESQRNRLARQLYAITITGDVRTETIPDALAGIQRVAAATGCSAMTIDSLTRAARDVARADPNPRQDWR